jgi:hypothetical protein
MSRRITITTPIPTLDEVVKDLGIGRARRDSILQIMKSAKAAKSKRISSSASQASSRNKRIKGRVSVPKTLARKKIA